MKLRLMMAVVAALATAPMASAHTLSVFTEGKRATTASGIPGVAAVNRNRDVGTFDAGTLSSGSFIFVGRAVGDGADSWAFTASDVFKVNVDWFASSTRKGGPDFGANLILDQITPLSNMITTTALPNAPSGVYGPGKYLLTIQSTRPDAFDYDLRVSVVPLPLGGALLLTGLAALGYAGRRTARQA